MWSSKTTMSVVAIAAGMFLVSGPTQGQTVIHVDDDASPGGNGTTWNTAYKYLQDALAVATSGNEIRVAGGVYKPDQDETGNVTAGDRAATFQLINGVGLYGGFRGCPGGDCSGNPDERDIGLYESILSGDLNSDDAPNESNCCRFHYGRGCDDPDCEAAVCSAHSWCCPYDQWYYACWSRAHTLCTELCGGNAENSYHVVTSGSTCCSEHNWPSCDDDECSASVCAIMPSCCNDTWTDECVSLAVDGCGSLCDTDGGVLEGFTITAGNASLRWTGEDGGGMLIISGSPTISRCTFAGNAAYSCGGGLHVDAGTPTVSNCVFRGNWANLGGGMANRQNGQTTLINCLFHANLASGFTADIGGGMWNLGNALLVNCTFYGNGAEMVGGGIANESGAGAGIILFNSILWGNFVCCWAPNQISGDAAVVFTCIEGGYDGEGNIGDDPLFVDPYGDDGIPWTGGDEDLHLQPDSPCIDTGFNPVVTVSTDLDGIPRIIDGDADGTTTVDMGAFEYFFDCNENDYPDVCDADCTALDGACNLAGCGTSDDCNGNALPDECDIAAGTSQDLDTNGIPDECECATVAEPAQTPGGEAGYAKCRYISFVPGNPGEFTALRVTLLDLPAPFDIHNGTTMWVAEPITEVSENAGKIDPAEAPPGYDTFWSARLSCGPPIYRDDWSTKSPLLVIGDAIVPGATYEVQAIHETCDVVGEPNYSAPLVVSTSHWGDSVGHCAVIPCTPPEGVVNVTTDVTACIDKFRNLPNAVLKSRADIEPNLPDWLVNISDITYVLDAFRGFAYPAAQTPPAPGWPGPTGCP